MPGGDSFNAFCIETSRTLICVSSSSYYFEINKYFTGGDKMSVYETPKSEGVEQKKRVDLGCGVNCDWGFGAGIAIAMIGPLPGPT